MYFKVKLNRTALLGGKDKKILETYFTEAEHFAEAGMKVINKLGKDIEVEDVCLMKTLKPAGNIEYAPTNKVFIVKFAEDIDIDGRTKTLKYPVPFYANNNEELQVILKLYLEQGLDNMRITTVSETQWKIIQ